MQGCSINMSISYACAIDVMLLGLRRFQLNSTEVSNEAFKEAAEIGQKGSSEFTSKEPFQQRAASTPMMRYLCSQPTVGLISSKPKKIYFIS